MRSASSAIRVATGRISFTQVVKSSYSNGVPSSLRLGYPMPMLAGSNSGSQALAQLKAATTPALVDDRLNSLNHWGSTKSFLSTSTRSVGTSFDRPLWLRHAEIQCIVVPPAYKLPSALSTYLG